MTYNTLCNLVPTFLSNLIFLPESFSSLHLSTHLNKSEFFVVLRTSHAILYLYFFLPAVIPPPATFTWLQRQNWKHTIWGDTFDSSWFVGGNTFETYHFLPLIFHVLEILVSCKAIFQSTVFLHVFGSFNFFSALFSLLKTLNLFLEWNIKCKTTAYASALVVQRLAGRMLNHAASQFFLTLGP